MPHYVCYKNKYLILNLIQELYLKIKIKKFTYKDLQKRNERCYCHESIEAHDKHREFQIHRLWICRTTCGQPVEFSWSKNRTHFRIGMPSENGSNTNEKGYCCQHSDVVTDLISTDTETISVRPFHSQNPVKHHRCQGEDLQCPHGRETPQDEHTYMRDFRIYHVDHGEAEHETGPEHLLAGQGHEEQVNCSPLLLEGMENIDVPDADHYCQWRNRRSCNPAVSKIADHTVRIF